MTKHAIVIGGTGMLKDVSLWLNAQGFTVTVIARDEQRLQRLKDEAVNSKQINTVSIDYYDLTAFRKSILEAVEQFGPCQLAIAWIHSSAAAALTILEKVRSQSSEEPWDLYQVRGSSASRVPTTPITHQAQCHYHQIILGFILNSDQSRWLTNGEIAKGVIKAIEKKSDLEIVGTVEPWEKRP